jgi:hypothetical protein
MMQMFLVEQLYTVIADNASLFKMNMQEVVEMVLGQCLPLWVETLTLVIAITFVGTANLLADWLKKTF